MEIELKEVRDRLSADIWEWLTTRKRGLGWSEKKTSWDISSSNFTRYFNILMALESIIERKTLTISQVANILLGEETAAKPHRLFVGRGYYSDGEVMYANHIKGGSLGWSTNTNDKFLIALQTHQEALCLSLLRSRLSGEMGYTSMGSVVLKGLTYRPLGWFNKSYPPSDSDQFLDSDVSFVITAYVQGTEEVDILRKWDRSYHRDGTIK